MGLICFICRSSPLALKLWEGHMKLMIAALLFAGPLSQAQIPPLYKGTAKPCLLVHLAYGLWDGRRASVLYEANGQRLDSWTENTTNPRSYANGYLRSACTEIVELNGSDLPQILFPQGPK